jgi:hypothetical protein
MLGGCCGRMSHWSLPSRDFSHCSSVSTAASMAAASDSFSAHVPAFVRTPSACRHHAVYMVMTRQAHPHHW